MSFSDWIGTLCFLRGAPIRLPLPIADDRSATAPRGAATRRTRSGRRAAGRTSSSAHSRSTTRPPDRFAGCGRNESSTLQHARPRIAEASADGDLRRLRKVIVDYARPDTRRALFQLLNTALPFCVLVGALLYAVDRGAWWAVCLALPAAALLVR